MDDAVTPRIQECTRMRGVPGWVRALAASAAAFTAGALLISGCSAATPAPRTVTVYRTVTPAPQVITRTRTVYRTRTVTVTVPGAGYPVDSDNPAWNCWGDLINGVAYSATPAGTWCAANMPN